MANNPQSGNQQAQTNEVVDSFRVRKDDAIAIPGEMTTFFQTHPKTGGKPWRIEWHRVGLRVEREDLLAVHGAWIIPFANITEINVSKPSDGGKK